MPYSWIESILDKPMPLCLILSDPALSNFQVVCDSEWIMEDKKEKIMYKVYICGKVIKLDERSIGERLQ